MTNWPKIFLGVAAMMAACLSLGQTYPVKPVRIVAADAPGAGDDYIARLVAGKLSESYGTQFIVENRPGAGGAIAQMFVAKSQPDGYTLLLGGASMAGAHLVNASATYNLQKDFAPISLLETNTFVMLAHRSVPAKNAAEFVKLARSQPGKMTFATIGAGQYPYWAVMLFNGMAGIKAVEVAYKGAPSAIVDLISGQVDYGFFSMLLAVTSKEKLRLLAVTGTQRAAMLPDVPTMAEAALPGYDMGGFRTMLAPAGVSREIIVSLNAAIGRALSTADIKERFLKAGSVATASNPEEVAKRYAEKTAVFEKIAKELGLKPQ